MPLFERKQFSHPYQCIPTKLTAFWTRFFLPFQPYLDLLDPDPVPQSEYGSGYRRPSNADPEHILVPGAVLCSIDLLYWYPLLCCSILVCCIPV
jgi:hypothetical protein